MSTQRELWEECRKGKLKAMTIFLDMETNKKLSLYKLGNDKESIVESAEEILWAFFKSDQKTKDYFKKLIGGRGNERN